MRMKVLSMLLVIALMLTGMSGMSLTAQAASSDEDGVVVIDDEDAGEVSDDDDVEVDDERVGECVRINEESIKMAYDNVSIEAYNVGDKQVIWEVVKVGTDTTITEEGTGHHEFKNIYKDGQAVLRVRAHFIEGNTEWSEPVYVVPCATLSKMKQSYIKKDKVILKWDKVEGATGYEVCMLVKNRTVFKTVAKTKATTKTIKVNLKVKGRDFIVKAVYNGQVAKENAGGDRLLAYYVKGGTDEDKACIL